MLISREAWYREADEKDLALMKRSDPQAYLVALYRSGKLEDELKATATKWAESGDLADYQWLMAVYGAAAEYGEERHLGGYIQEATSLALRKRVNAELGHSWYAQPNNRFSRGPSAIPIRVYKDLIPGRVVDLVGVISAPDPKVEAPSFTLEMDVGSLLLDEMVTPHEAYEPYYEELRRLLPNVRDASNPRVRRQINSSDALSLDGLIELLRRVDAVITSND